MQKVIVSDWKVRVITWTDGTFSYQVVTVDPAMFKVHVLFEVDHFLSEKAARDAGEYFIDNYEPKD